MSKVAWFLGGTIAGAAALAAAAYYFSEDDDYEGSSFIEDQEQDSNLEFTKEEDMDVEATLQDATPA